MHNTIFDKTFELKETIEDFEYQKKLTNKLDECSTEFDQNTINEIVLWKINRYALLEKETMYLLNQIDSSNINIDEPKTRELLFNLLGTKGIKLAMASTILRFKNPRVYQIIDQRAYRVINPGKILRLKDSKSVENRQSQIDLYLRYLKDLKVICSKFNIKFEESDRILYLVDKRINKEYKLSN